MPLQGITYLRIVVYKKDSHIILYRNFEHERPTGAGYRLSKKPEQTLRSLRVLAVAYAQHISDLMNILANCLQVNIPSDALCTSGRILEVTQSRSVEAHSLIGRLRPSGKNATMLRTTPAHIGTNLTGGCA